LSIEISPNEVTTKIETFDLNDGSYHVDYLIAISGVYTLTVVTNGDLPDAKSSEITVIPYSPEFTTSTITLNTIIEVGVEETVSVNINDQFNNQVADVLPIVLLVTGNDQEIF
jgi:hypothetical protein